MDSKQSVEDKSIVNDDFSDITAPADFTEPEVLYKKLIETKDAQSQIVDITLTRFAASSSLTHSSYPKP